MMMMLLFLLVINYIIILCSSPLNFYFSRLVFIIIFSVFAILLIAFFLLDYILVLIFIIEKLLHIIFNFFKQLLILIVLNYILLILFIICLFFGAFSGICRSINHLKLIIIFLNNSLPHKSISCVIFTLDIQVFFWLFFDLNLGCWFNFSESLSKSIVFIVLKFR
jgi:hypothetical protein